MLLVRLCISLDLDDRSWFVKTPSPLSARGLPRTRPEVTVRGLRLSGLARAVGSTPHQKGARRSASMIFWRKLSSNFRS